MSAQFTKIEGQYLAFIYNYSIMYDRAPAERDLQIFFGVTYPTVHQTIVKLDSKNLINRVPGQARSITLNIDLDSLPRLVRPISRKT